VTFVQRFGWVLNARTHLHCCVTDGVFSLDADGTLRFHRAADLSAVAVSAVQRRIRRRVLWIAVRCTASVNAAGSLPAWIHPSEPPRCAESSAEFSRARVAKFSPRPSRSMNARALASVGTRMWLTWNSLAGSDST
jgi:hypothetical protein